MDSIVLFKLEKQDKQTLKQMARKERLSLSSFIRNKLLTDVEE
jgi:nucleoid-associated protein YejK